MRAALIVVFLREVGLARDIMTKNFFGYFYLACLGVASVIRAHYARRIRREVEVGKTLARSYSALDTALLVISFAAMVVLPITSVFTRWLAFADYSVPVWASFFGMAAGVLGVWLLRRSHTDLGLNWAMELRMSEGQTLVTSGSYSHIRHPMYAAHWLLAISQVLMIQNWVAGPAFLVVMIPLYHPRVRREEEMLIEHFGDSYRAYMSRTGRVVPRLWKRPGL